MIEILVFLVFPLCLIVGTLLYAKIKKRIIIVSDLVTIVIVSFAPILNVFFLLVWSLMWISGSKKFQAFLRKRIL